MSITNTSKPVYMAVLLDMDTEALELQQQLNAPLLSNHADQDDNIQSQTSTTGPATIKILNFLLGLLTGAAFSCAGFAVLIRHWQDMLKSDVMLFSVLWSSVTSVSAYLLFSLLYIATCSYFASDSKSSSLSKTLESQYTIAVLEYCFAVGVFLGFCGACTWTDVAYGMPASSILLTVTVAAAWAALMVCCALSVSDKNTKNSGSDEQEQAQRRLVRGTVLPLVFV
jgi:formate-dependent nitrite reductase membrane component NrfD